MAYVASFADGVVTPIDTATNLPGPPIGVTPGPRAIAITPDGKTAFVAGAEAAVTRITTATNQADPPIGLSGTLAAIAITPDGETAYVVSEQGDVTPIVVETGQPLTPISLGFAPPGENAIAITPDKRTAYVVRQERNEVLPIDLETRDVGERISVGAPSSIAITPDGKTAWVASFDGTVVPINTATNEGGEPVLLGEQLFDFTPTSIAITPDGRTAYAATIEGSVIPVDLVARSAGDPITVGSFPVTIAITPDGGTAYAVNRGDGTVTPIDTVTNEAGDPIAVGSSPVGMAIAPNQPPTAELSAPDSAIVGQPVSFDATGSSDDTGVADYTFAFGDGAFAKSSDGTRRYVYPDPGTYLASVTVDDGEGCEPDLSFFPEFASPFTGQTAYCNGPSRVTSTPVEIEVFRRLGLRASAARRQSSLRSVRVRASCVDVGCEAAASGRLAVGKGRKAKRFKLAPGRRSLAAGESAVLAPRIPAAARRAARRAFKRGGKVAAKLEIAASGPGDQRLARTLQVRIVR